MARLQSTKQWLKALGRRVFAGNQRIGDLGLTSVLGPFLLSAPWRGGGGGGGGRGGVSDVVHQTWDVPPCTNSP